MSQNYTKNVPFTLRSERYTSLKKHFANIPKYTSYTGSLSFDQRVRGGTPSFMARESFAREVDVTLPT